MVDNYESACAAALDCRRNGADALFLYVTTYTLSSTVLALVRRAALPTVVINLQPGEAIDYAAVNSMDDRIAMTGEWLAWCATCPMPEIANLFARAGWRFRQVNGSLTDPETNKEIMDWVRAVRVQSQLMRSRLGLMGHYYSGMLDIATDLTRLAVTFGIHPEMIELEELSSLAGQVDTAAVQQRCIVMQSVFDFDADCPAEELQLAARTSLALDQLVAKHSVDALAYYVKAAGNAQNEETIRSIIPGASFITSRHIPAAGEYEVKNALAMKILDLLDAGGSFSEYYALDLSDDVVLMGHDGPGHPAIAEGKIRIRPLRTYHGKSGQGLSVEMSVKHGPVTLLSVAEDASSGYKFVTAEGMSVPGPILEIGNTNSRYRFSVSAREFVQRWNTEAPAHHCAIGVGHVSRTLEKLASLLNVGFTRIC